MQYLNVIPARFISRPNRFIAIVDAGNGPEIAHVKNTGRCKELLIPGCKIYLEISDNPSRKTKYDLIAVLKGDMLINMDSQIPNAAAAEWLANCGLFSPSAKISREVTFGNSRFDISVTDGDRSAFIEVKGVTLENDGIALFPDAPTTRGLKHIEELITAKKAGFDAYIMFVIQMKGIKLFKPNEAMQPEFAEALRKARANGVEILAFDSIVTHDSIVIDSPVKIEL